GRRHYRSKSNHGLDFRKLRPVILKRIEDRSKNYPIKALIPVADEVLRAREILHCGVSALITRIPIWACKFCPEVYIGESGHLIQTCRGYRHHAKNKRHQWIEAQPHNVLLPVETFHLDKSFQTVIKHDRRFDFDRIPAVVELCLQAGAASDHRASDRNGEAVSEDELRLVGMHTLKAWESLRTGVHRLLCAYPARVCRHCSEVHVGGSGHEARTCGLFKFQRWRGSHFWEKAKVDDLVPPNLVWCRRRQDPPVLVEEGRNYYGRCPAVVDLCSKAGALVPSKYFCIMKFEGATPP
ncbi:hypothetical protein M569_14314, partial [Genlisea aurea]